MLPDGLRKWLRNLRGAANPDLRPGDRVRVTAWTEADRIGVLLHRRRLLWKSGWVVKFDQPGQLGAKDIVADSALIRLTDPDL